MRAPTFGNAIWQKERADELAFDRGADREFLIRAAAAHAITHPQTYRGGLRMPWRMAPPVTVDPPEERVSYSELMIQLHPGLELYPKEAQLIAEQIIRHQVAEIEEHPQSEWHRVGTPEFISTNRKDLWGDATEYRLCGKADDQLLRVAKVVPGIERREFSKDIIERGIKSQLAHAYMSELAKILGLGEWL